MESPRCTASGCRGSWFDAENGDPGPGLEARRGGSSVSVVTTGGRVPVGWREPSTDASSSIIKIGGTNQGGGDKRKWHFWAFLSRSNYCPTDLSPERYRDWVWRQGLESSEGPAQACIAGL
jgi:hypothetical protein